MEENKDELLQAFENPDMADTEVAAPVENEYVENTSVETEPVGIEPTREVEPEISPEVQEQYAPVTPEVNFMPEEFQQALNQEEVVQPEPAPVQEEVVESAQEVEPVEDMQNVPESLNPEPVVSVTQDIKEENRTAVEDDDMSYKKVLIFLAPIVLIMIAFILVLPLITKI